MARRTPPIDDEKRRLELELFIARQTILLLMPEDIQEYLEGHWACESYQDIVAWRSWCVHGFVRLAESGPIYGLEINRPQARCPLCKGEPASARSSGYALPTGLERHLTGYGRMSQLTSAACSGAPISRRWRCIGAARRGDPQVRLLASRPKPWEEEEKPASPSAWARSPRGMPSACPAARRAGTSARLPPPWPATWRPCCETPPAGHYSAGANNPSGPLAEQQAACQRGRRP